MKRILVIINNPRQAAYRLRIASLRQSLADRGLELDVQPRPRSWLARRRLLRSADAFHAVVLQRKLLDPSDARLLRRHARRIIYDLDDAVMYSPTPLNMIKQWLLTRRYHATAAVVDHVVAGNEYLAQHFRQRGCAVTVLPTLLDPGHYQVKTHAPSEAPVLVWIGSAATLPYLEGCRPAIENAALQMPGLRLRIIAGRAMTADVPVDFVPWSEATEAEALLGGDIGIAPTPADRWTLGKCGFKIVQYMAAGLPVIASPVGVNAHLVSDGVTGVLASTPREWSQAIVNYGRDWKLRADAGRAGRQVVEREWDIARAADVWASLLDR